MAAASDSSAKNSSATDVPPPGYHDINSDGAIIRVANQPTVHTGDQASDDGKYDPSNADFSRTSSYANKSFSTGFAAISKDDTAEESRDNKRFITGAYATRSFAESSRPYQTVAYTDAARSSSLNKSFTLPAAFDSNHTFDTGKKSDLAGKQALIAQTPAKIDPLSAPGALTEKTFYDPAMTKVKRDPYVPSMDVKRLSEIPNRPMTIDEVRNLINHEQVPDLNSAPDAASKPLNDPGWEPSEVAPPALDERPIKPGPTTEDQTDDLPSPGMMAQPAATPAPVKK